MSSDRSPFDRSPSDRSPFDRDSWPLTDREAFQSAVRKWITANWSVSITVREWWRRLADAGLTVPTWATSLGGIGATTALQGSIEQELARIGTVAPPLSGVGVHLVGPTLRQHGTDDQRRALLASIVDGTSNWCLLFDEPDSADPADTTSTGTNPNSSAGSSAGSSGGSTAGSWSSGIWSPGTQAPTTWSIDAVKLSDDAELADLGLMVVRTDPASTGRDGLTCVVVAIDQPTISVQRLSTGASVVVCRGATTDAVVGAPGDGFTVAQTVLAHRRTSLAGRIRRGLVEVAAGEKAGNLDRTTGDVLTRTRAKPGPAQERRRRP